MTLRAIVFAGIDSIVHTRIARRTAYNAVFAEAGLDWQWDEALFSELEKAGDPVNAFIRRQKRWVETDDTRKLRTALHRHYKTVSLKNILSGSARPGVRALIDAARGEGIKIAIVSTGPDAETAAILNAMLGETAGNAFNAIVCRETIDPRQIEADTFMKAVDALAVPPNAGLAICSGDGGLTAAILAGLGAIVVRNGSANDHDAHEALAVADELPALTGTDTNGETHTFTGGSGLLAAIRELHVAHCSNTISHRVRASSNWTVFERGVKSMKVAEILKAKGRGFMSVRPDETIQAFAERLKAEKVGALIVSASGTSLDGIISERDLAYGLAVHGDSLARMPVSALMTKSVITCSPANTIAEVMGTMTQRRIRHLPVKDGDQVVGIISIGDVLKHRLDEMRLEANVLRDYAIARR